MTAPKTGGAGVYRMRLGDFEVLALSDGSNTLPIENLLTDITLDSLPGTFRHDGLPPTATLAINTFLVDTGNRRVLVDAGGGDSFKPHPPSVADAGHMLESLAEAGYAPEQIDTVLLTHTHGDHAGGLVKDGKAVFTNAIVHLNRIEADFWLNRDNIGKAPAQAHAFALTEAILRVYQNEHRLKAFEDGAEVVPGIRVVPGHGHTPGHSFFLLESRGQRMLLWGDVIHSAAVQFPYPASMVRFDVDSNAAARMREAVLHEAAREGYWVGATHIAFPGVGHVHSDGNAYRWLPAD